MVSWGVAWANAKIVTKYFDFYDLVFLRFIFGSISLFPIIYFSKQVIKFKVSYIKYVLPASILFLFYNISFFMGTHYGEAGRGAVFATTTNPIITLLLISVIERRINRFEVGGILLGFLGGALIMDIYSSGLAYMFTQENIYFPICSILWSVITILISYAQKKVPPFQFIFFCYLFTALISAPFANITYLEVSNLDVIFYGNFFMVAIASMAFGTSIYIYASNLIGPVRSSVFIFSVPFIALISAAMILKERVELMTVFRGLLCIFAIFIVNKKNNVKGIR